MNLRIIYILLLIVLSLGFYTYDERRSFKIYRREQGGKWFKVQTPKKPHPFWTQDPHVAQNVLNQLLETEDYS